MKLWDGSYRYHNCTIQIWDLEKIWVQYGFTQYRYYSSKFAMIWQILILFVYPEWLWSKKLLKSLGITRNTVNRYGYNLYHWQFQPIWWQYRLTHQFDGHIHIWIWCGSLCSLASSDFKVVYIPYLLYSSPQLVTLYGQKKAALSCSVFLIFIPYLHLIV